MSEIQTRVSSVLLAQLTLSKNKHLNWFKFLNVAGIYVVKLNSVYKLGLFVALTFYLILACYYVHEDI